MVTLWLVTLLSLITVFSVMAAVLASGGRVGVVRNAEEMLGLLDAWGIPRARRLVLRGGVAAQGFAA